MFSIALPRVLARTGSQKDDLPAILVLERDRDEQRIFQYMLEPFCHVSFAADTERIVDRLGVGRCDGVLLKLDLCDDPARLISRIRALPDSSGTLLVGVSTQNLAGERQQILALGFDEHLFKPISKQSLLNILGSLTTFSQGFR